MLVQFALLLSFVFSGARAAGSTATSLAERASPDLKALLSRPQKNWCSGTQVFYSGQANYQDLTTQRWTTYEAPSYLASVKPACVEDVKTIVKLCVSNNIPFLATGGRHGYSTSFGKLENGIELDLGGFKTVEVDKEASTMTIGGAVTFQDVYEPLYAAGKEIATGSCTCVGFVGGTLGGGVGRYQGLHGLIIDSLLSVELITAEGKAITVSATENADLFWGMRGAGMNFGVVISATYEVADLTNEGKVQSADFVFTASQNESYFNALASFEGKLPKELSLLTYIDYNETHGGASVLLNAVYPGPLDTFKELIKPFTDLKPAVQVINTIPWNRILVDAGFGLVSAVCVKGQQHSLYSVATKKLSVPDYISAFGKYKDLYERFPETRASTLEIEIFPTQGVVAVPLDSTAYPWRDVEAQVMIQMQFTGSPTGPAANAANAVAKELRTAFTKTSGYDQLEIYISYAHGDEDPASWYGADKLTRLVPLKKKWDPKNVFSYYNSIPMKYP